MKAGQHGTGQCTLKPQLRHHQESDNQELEQELRSQSRQLILIRLARHGIPNAPHASVPGWQKSSDDNETIRAWGQAENADHATPHWDFAKTYGLIDFELGGENHWCRFSGVSRKRCKAATLAHSVLS